MAFGTIKKLQAEKIASRKQMRSIAQKVVNKNLETKFRTISYVQTDVASTGTTGDLCYIAEGSSQNERTGNQIRVTGIHFPYYVQCTDTTNVVRVIFYKPKDPNDTLTSTGIYTNLDVDKYIIYHDKVHLLSLADNNFSKGSFNKSFKGKKKDKAGLVVQYHGATANAYAKNPIYIYMVSDSGAISHPMLSGNLKLYFKDA